MPEPEVLPPPPPPPKVGDTVRINAPDKQELNQNSPAILVAIDEETGICTLSRQGIVLERREGIPVVLSMLVKVPVPDEPPAPQPAVPPVVPPPEEPPA